MAKIAASTAGNSRHGGGVRRRDLLSVSTGTVVASEVPERAGPSVQSPNPSDDSPVPASIEGHLPGIDAGRIRKGPAPNASRAPEYVFLDHSNFRIG